MHEKPVFNPETMEDVSIPLSQIMVHALGLSIIMLVIPIIPYVLIWGMASLLSALTFPPMLLVLLGVFILLIIHEATHALGWIIFGGTDPKTIRFGVDLKTLSPYAHTHAPMPVSGYRIGVILPLIVTGILPVLIGTLTANPILTTAGAVLVSGAVGDVLVLWAIRHVPSNRRVQDHPSNAGCYVLLD